MHGVTPEAMAAYLEARLEAADGGAAFIARALGDLARTKGPADRPWPGQTSERGVQTAMAPPSAHSGLYQPGTPSSTSIGRSSI